jgi:hypothetical protein
MPAPSDFGIADMMRAPSSAGVLARRCGRSLFPALLLAGVLVQAPCWQESAWAGEAAGKATEEADLEPSFDLPPIVVQVPAHGTTTARTIVLRTALVFDETDRDRITDSQRLAKALLPKIMDSVITGVQGHRVKDWSNTSDVNQVILDRAAAVLGPYGVLIKTLRVELFGSH